MRLIYLLSFLLLSISSVHSQGIEFFHGTWQEAIEEAKTQEKIVFVDAYTTWCGPCKRMSKNVFTQAKVGNYFNDNFINIKIDMEKTNGREFGSKYPVSAYPTLFFLDSNGKLIKKSVGGKNVEALVNLGQDIMSKYDFSTSFREAYDAGDHSFENVVGYIEALNKSNKSSLKIANDFIRENKDLSESQKTEFYYKATSEVDSRIFDEMINRKAAIIKSFGEIEFKEKVVKSAYKTVDKSIKYEDENLFKLAVKIVKKHSKTDAKLFEAKSGMQVAAAKEDIDSYLKYSKKYIKEQNNLDTKMSWARMAEAEFPKNKKVLNMIYDIVRKDVQLTKDKNHITTYCKVLLQLEKHDEALAYAKSAEKRTEDKATQKHIQNLIRYIEKSS